MGPMITGTFDFDSSRRFPLIIVALALDIGQQSSDLGLEVGDAGDGQQVKVADEDGRFGQEQLLCFHYHAQAP